MISFLVSFILLFGGETATAEPFATLYNSPGHVGILVHATGGDEASILYIRADAPGGHSTVTSASLKAREQKDFVFSVYCSGPGLVRVSTTTNDGRTRQEIANFPAISGKKLLFTIGALAEAERASDLFNISLPDIIKLQTLPPRTSGFADAFHGVVVPAGDSAIFEDYYLRGGTLQIDGAAHSDPPALHDANGIARAAALLPDQGLAPRDFVNLQFLPGRIAIAAAGLLAAAILILQKKPALLWAVIFLIPSLATAAVVWGCASASPGIRVRSIGHDDLVIRATKDAPPAKNGSAARTVAYPCGRSLLQIRSEGGSLTFGAEPFPVFAFPADALSKPATAIETGPAELLQIRLRPFVRTLATEFGSARVFHDGSTGEIWIDRPGR